MARPQTRIAVVQIAFALMILGIITRAAQLQLFQGERWTRQAQRQRTERVVLPARRGALYDREGVPLAISQEFYHVGVAPNELADSRHAVRLLTRHLGVSRAALERDLRGRKRWIYYHGPYTASQVQPLRKTDGIHLTGDFQRFYPSQALARPIIGGLSPEDAAGAAGLELSLDSILKGQPG
jgi:cell division protein FtsI/penicillin-binding protein 2